MKKIQLGSLITLFALTLFIFSCGSEGHSHDENGTETTQTDENNEASSEEVDMDGKEYTSVYVCTMHCKGSGSDVAGTCPVCGMAYVASADLDTDGGSEDNNAEGDDDDHEGHNH
jgi:hypothetical protein